MAKTYTLNWFLDGKTPLDLHPDDPLRRIYEYLQSQDKPANTYDIAIATGMSQRWALHNLGLAHFVGMIEEVSDHTWQLVTDQERG